MNAQGWFFVNGTGGPFNVDGAAVQIEVFLISEGGARVQVQVREARQGQGGVGRIVQDVEIRGAGDSVKVVVEER